MNGPYLDLAPHYQRGVVWTRKAMRLLIDSMWKGYYIPPVRPLQYNHLHHYVDISRLSST